MYNVNPIFYFKNFLFHPFLAQIRIQQPKLTFIANAFFENFVRHPFLTKICTQLLKYVFIWLENTLRNHFFYTQFSQVLTERWPTSLNLASKRIVGGL